MSSVTPRPFKIAIPQERVDRLKQRLSIDDLPDELDGSAWDYGVPLSDMKRLVKAWQEWDWREAERKLNQVPMYTMDVSVDGYGTLDIHFVHQKSDIKGAIPLLFVHGWPGSFIESLKILPLLSDAKRTPTSPAFHIVAPSLANFGFSQGVSKRGFAVAQHAETCHKLMLQLGYTQYVTQGGDIGTIITRAMGSFFPESCKASHLNYIRGNPPPKYDVSTLTAEERRGLERTEWFEKEGRGYNLLQQTKPQTLAYALSSSPVALLAWIYEKLHDWSDAYAWTADEIFTWISIYAFSRAGPGASARIYYESMHTVPEEGKRTFSSEDAKGFVAGVRLGMTFNPKELVVMPPAWCRGWGEVVYEAVNDHGGHFYAHEHPELLVRDLHTMFGKGGGASGVVEGKTGYEV